MTTYYLIAPNGRRKLEAKPNTGPSEGTIRRFLERQGATSCEVRLGGDFLLVGKATLDAGTFAVRWKPKGTHHDNW